MAHGSPLEITWSAGAGWPDVQDIRGALRLLDEDADLDEAQGALFVGREELQVFTRLGPHTVLVVSSGATRSVGLVKSVVSHAVASIFTRRR